MAAILLAAIDREGINPAITGRAEASREPVDRAAVVPLRATLATSSAFLAPCSRTSVRANPAPIVPRSIVQRVLATAVDPVARAPIDRAPATKIVRSVQTVRVDREANDRTVRTKVIGRVAPVLGPIDQDVRTRATAPAVLVIARAVPETAIDRSVLIGRIVPVKMIARVVRAKAKSRIVPIVRVSVPTTPIAPGTTARTAATRTSIGVRSGPISTSRRSTTSTTAGAAVSTTAIAGDRYPNRYNYWRGWGNHVRTHWAHPGYRGWFNTSWWNLHYHALGGWHYHYSRFRYPPSYWWGVPTWAGLSTWFTWTRPGVVWAQPVYYDYGTGGNVVYQNNNVYVGGQQVASAADFAMSAADLATVPPPPTPEAAEDVEWMALGTFAVSSNEKETDPSRVMQLAVDKDGVVSGTLFNTQTNEAETVQGRVDKETQRVAMRIGDKENIVVETGLYNLTQNEAPALVHFGPDKVEDWLLVRLEDSEAQ